LRYKTGQLLSQFTAYITIHDSTRRKVFIQLKNNNYLSDISEAMGSAWLKFCFAFLIFVQSVINGAEASAVSTVSFQF